MVLMVWVTSANFTFKMLIELDQLGTRRYTKQIQFVVCQARID